MKFFIVSLFVITLAFANAKESSDSSSSLDEEQYKQVAKMLEDKFNITILADIEHLAKKAKENCPHIEEKIDEVGEKIEKCIEDIELGSETFCSLIRKNFGKCSEPAIELIASCLPKESKDLPKMAEKIIAAIVDQACNSTVEEILELLNPCKFKEDFDSVPACSEIKDVFVQHKNQLPSKSLICSTLPKVRNCMKAHVDKSCQNTITRRASLGFYDAIDAAIKDDCDALNKA